jgi:GABA(A) receptor-associated protein
MSYINTFKKNIEHKSFFEKELTLDQRKLEAEKLKTKYPDRIPCIVDKNPLSKDMIEIHKKKYLVPGEITIGQFMMILRKKIRLTPTQGFYVFCNNTMIASSCLLRQVYVEYKKEDGFLYFTYSSENTFG